MSETYGTGQLRKLLRDRHAPKRGSRAEWAYLEEVRNAPGFEASRSLDALAIHLWPSRGHEIHGYEIKCSRSDWLREVAEPAKAEAFASWCDRFWVVAAPGVVRDELPIAWGLLEPARQRGGGEYLKVKKQAAATPSTITPDERARLACCLSAAGVRLEVSPDQAAVQEAARAMLTAERAALDADRRMLARREQQAQEQVSALRQQLHEATKLIRDLTGHWLHLDCAIDRQRFVRTLALAQRADAEELGRRCLEALRNVAKAISATHQRGVVEADQRVAEFEAGLRLLAGGHYSALPEGGIDALLDWLAQQQSELAS